MKKYLLLLFVLTNNYVFGQLTSIQFSGSYIGETILSNSQHWDDTLIVLDSNNDTLMIFDGLFILSDYDIGLEQDSSFIYLNNPSIRYGHFYNIDSVYIYYRLDIYGNYAEFWGKKQNTNIKGLNSERNDITVYPNPAGNKIFVSGLTAHEQFKINIYNSMAEIILSSDKNSLDVSELPQGMYFLKVENKQGIVTKKIIVQH